LKTCLSVPQTAEPTILTSPSLAPTFGVGNLSVRIFFGAYSTGAMTFSKSPSHGGPG
jgi:hypothetical protein